MSSRTVVSVESGLCVQRERRPGEGRGLGWVLGGKGGWASWGLRGSRVSHSTCSRWKRCAKEHQRSVCMCICYGNQACFCRIWQPGLGLGQGIPGQGLTQGLHLNSGRSPASRPLWQVGLRCPEPPVLLPGAIKARPVSRAHLLLAGSTAVQETLPHPLPGAAGGPASRWGLSLVGTCVWLPHCPDSSMAHLGRPRHWLPATGRKWVGTQAMPDPHPL